GGGRPASRCRAGVEGGPGGSSSPLSEAKRTSCESPLARGTLRRSGPRVEKKGGSRGVEQPAERSEADKLRIPPGSWNAPKERTTRGRSGEVDETPPDRLGDGLQPRMGVE